jgi:hypothetical protein
METGTAVVIGVVAAIGIGAAVAIGLSAAAVQSQKLKTMQFTSGPFVSVSNGQGTVMFNTNNASRSSVYWGTIAATPSGPASDNVISTTHTVTFGVAGEFHPSHTYYVKVVAYDALTGKGVTYGPTTFIGSDVVSPHILNLQVLAGAMPGQNARFDFDTSEPTEAEVRCGLVPGIYTVNSGFTAFASHHTIPIGGFMPGATVYYVIIVRDAADNEHTTTEATFVAS